MHALSWFQNQFKITPKPCSIPHQPSLIPPHFSHYVNNSAFEQAMNKKGEIQENRSNKMLRVVSNFGEGQTSG